MDTTGSSNVSSVSFEYELPAQNIRARRHDNDRVSYSYDIEFDLKPEDLLEGKYMLNISLTRKQDGSSLGLAEHRREMKADSDRTLTISGSLWSEDEGDPAQSGQEVEVDVFVLITVSSAWPNPFGSLVPKPSGAFHGIDRETPRDKNSNAVPGTYNWSVVVTDFTPSCNGMPNTTVSGVLTFDSTSIVDGLVLDGNNSPSSATCTHDEVKVCYNEQDINWVLQP